MAYGICKGGPLDGTLLATANTADGDRVATLGRVGTSEEIGVYEWNGMDETFDFTATDTALAALRRLHLGTTTNAATAASEGAAR